MRYEGKFLDGDSSFVHDIAAVAAEYAAYAFEEVGGPTSPQQCRQAEVRRHLSMLDRHHAREEGPQHQVSPIGQRHVAASSLDGPELARKRSSRAAIARGKEKHADMQRAVPSVRTSWATRASRIHLRKSSNTQQASHPNPFERETDVDVDCRSQSPHYHQQ